jgi:glutathione S-transferase
MYKLYVIPGSHACRSGMLMLEHKRVPYRRVEFITLTHATMARLHGFDAGGQTRVAGGRRTPGIRMGDLLGTVPGLADGERRISTNYGIARYLDEQHPERPLLPDDPQQRKAVEEAESWANDTLQMAARRIVFSAALQDPAALTRATDDGRMGYLLYRSALVRRLITPWIGRLIFATRPGEDGRLVAELSEMLDRIDVWVDRGVLNGPELNVADFMVAPSLALILYRPDVLPIFEGRPALELVDRLLPEPQVRVPVASQQMPPPVASHHTSL